MDPEERKAEIKRRLILGRYPTRWTAQFTAENDHNPLVLVRCAKCRGAGAYDTSFDTPSGVAYERNACDQCSGSGVIAEIEPFFDNSREPIAVTPNADGWVGCPICGTRFHLDDPNAFTGLRHKMCGQKLLVKLSPSES